MISRLPLLIPASVSGRVPSIAVIFGLFLMSGANAKSTSTACSTSAMIDRTNAA